jgi:hypothetical protein
MLSGVRKFVGGFSAGINLVVFLIAALLSIIFVRIKRLKIQFYLRFGSPKM